ncbi:hypothetical protein [Streptococcus suis]|nr:hypothetical protein [Streptococcus suis]MDN2948180.1 hypothetical protein [Streptococcus suis]
MALCRAYLLIFRPLGANGGANHDFYSKTSKNTANRMHCAEQ